MESPYILEGQIELDEKYFPRNHKGQKIENIKSKKRGGPASKRGLSGEQVCVLTGTERFGKAVAHALNMAKPKSQDILNWGNIYRKKALYFKGCHNETRI